MLCKHREKGSIPFGSTRIGLLEDSNQGECARLLIENEKGSIPFLPASFIVGEISLLIGSSGVEHSVEARGVEGANPSRSATSLWGSSSNERIPGSQPRRYWFKSSAPAIYRTGSSVRLEQEVLTLRVGGSNPSPFSIFERPWFKFTGRNVNIMRKHVRDSTGRN